MPRQRLSLLNLEQLTGLSLVGPATQLPPSTLRSARGLHETCKGELRPCPGNRTLFIHPHPLVIARFDDHRYYIAGGTLYQDDTAILTGFTGTHIILTRLPPGNTQRDQLFTSGGGMLRKITGTTATLWGIEAPSNTMNAVLGTQLTKNIELFEVSADWTVSPGTVTVSNEATIKQEGTNALQVDIPLSTLATVTKTFGTPLDLSLFSTAGDSSDEDFIEFNMRIDASAQSFDYCTLRFDVGDGTFGADYYQYKILPTSVTVNDRILKGIGATPRINRNELAFLSDQGGNETEGIANDLGESLDAGPGDGSGPSGSGDAPFSSATWSRIRLMRKSFHRSGNGTGTWANVVAMQLMIRTNSQGPIVCYFDHARMRGGAGMFGNYRSLVTFDNLTTGHRSNANSFSQNTFQNDRQPIIYTAIPLSTDPQVTARTLWRTLGNGRLFFREHVIPDNTTTTYTSRIADFTGLWSNLPSAVLYLPELPTDNAVPHATHGDFIYDQSVVFWLNNALTRRGRVYFSPAGRPEAQRGFIEVCQSDTPLCRLIVWNRARFAFGSLGIWRIDGNGPYTAFHFEGLPGVHTAQARTLVPTPYGIIGQATDGLRRFNGSTSELLSFDRIGPLFRGEPLGQLSSFMGTCAAFARDQYFISDGTQTLSINLSNGFIRDLGQGFHSFYYEEETGALLGGNDTSVVIIEDPTIPPSLPCTWETAALYAPSGQTNTLLILYIDACSGDIPMEVTLLIDDIPHPLPSLELAQRGIKEYPLGLRYQSASVRITLPFPQPLSRVYAINADIYTNTNA